jgi:RES domain-containing protein
MVATVWRIAADTASYRAEDLTGTGAEKTGGRWNRKGTPVVYASTSIALACLEAIVHLGGSEPLPLNRYLISIDLPRNAWAARALFKSSARAGWDALPAGPVSLDWGTDWARSGQTLLADVPSIVVPEESNVLINPRHSDAARVSVTKLRRWTFDHRLYQSG